MLEELKAKGYEIDDLRQAKHRQDDGVSVETMEKNGWSMWFAKLPDIRRGKCNSCDAYISTLGIQTHGHKCENCGEATYYDVVDGTRMRFEFLSERYRGVMFSPQLSMNAKRWDTEEGFIYFYREFHDGGLSVVTGERAEAYLAEHAGLWEEVEEDGVKLLKMRYPNPWRRDEAAIEPYETYGHHFNYKKVKLWDGTEYREWDRLPIPEMISIYEAWHWSPVPKSPTIHERIMSACGQVSDKGYYYQDGRIAIYEGVRDPMARFIRHFTELDAEAFLAAWPRFRKSGPGFIDDFARFCHEAPIIENRPNFGNTLVAMGKAVEGKPLSRHELDEAERGVREDPVGLDFLSEVISSHCKK